LSTHSASLAASFTAALVTAASGFAVQPACAQSVSYETLQVVNFAVQSVIQNIRNQIQSNATASAPGRQVLRFSAEETHDDYNDIFGPLAYANSPLLTKAMPMPAQALPQWGVWGTGSGTWQRSTTGGVTTNSSTASGVGGVDYTKFGLLTATDALVVGVNGSDTETRTSAGTNTISPGIGAFAAYVNGGFSADFSFVGLFSSTSGAAGVPSTDSYSYTGDLNYRFDLPQAWWIEPTVGATYANTFFNAAGAAVGQIFTVQGGARVGTEFVLNNGVKVQPTFFGLAYSNVVENTGGVVNGATPGVPFVPGVPALAGGGAMTGPDRGQVWGKGDAKFNFVFNQHFSAYVEGAIYGTSGNFNALAGAVFGGLRYVFN
jgi:hypothetical protein